LGRSSAQRTPPVQRAVRVVLVAAIRDRVLTV
jgi:hypothetical protein